MAGDVAVLVNTMTSAELLGELDDQTSDDSLSHVVDPIARVESADFDGQPERSAGAGATAQHSLSLRLRERRCSQM